MRTNYRNGDDIGLVHTGCDGCSPSMINGVLCHEHGCPDAWRDYERECRWCGTEFAPTHPDETFCCGDCTESYYS